METGIKRESMVFYSSFFEAIQELPPEEFKKCACAILGYGLNGVVPETSGVEKSIFVLIKPQIDKNNQRWSNAKKSKEVPTCTGEKSASVSKTQSKKETKPEVDAKVEEIVSSADEDEVQFDDYEEVFGAIENDETPVGDIPEKCGEFGNVLLSANERQKLINRLGVREYEARLDFFSMYLKKKPDHRSACHYVDMMDWVGNAVDERREKEQSTKKKDSPLLDFDFEDFFEKP